ANEHRVDVVPVEHTAIVSDNVECLRERTRSLKALLLGLRDLTPHRELDVVVAREGVEHAAGAAAHADDGHPDAIVRPLDAAARRKRTGGGDAQRTDGRLQKLSPTLHGTIPFSTARAATGRRVCGSAP